MSFLIREILSIDFSCDIFKKRNEKCIFRISIKNKMKTHTNENLKIEHEIR